MSQMLDRVQHILDHPELLELKPKADKGGARYIVFDPSLEGPPLAKQVSEIASWLIAASNPIDMTHQDSIEIPGVIREHLKFQGKPLRLITYWNCDKMKTECCLWFTNYLVEDEANG